MIPTTNVDSRLRVSAQAKSKSGRRESKEVRLAKSARERKVSRQVARPGLRLYINR